MSTNPYGTIKCLWAKLENEGVSPDVIVDALLCTGLNASRVLAGDNYVIAFLHRMIAMFEASAKHQQPAPKAMQ